MPGDQIFPTQTLFGTYDLVTAIPALGEWKQDQLFMVNFHGVERILEFWAAKRLKLCYEPMCQSTLVLVCAAT